MGNLLSQPRSRSQLIISLSSSPTDGFLGAKSPFLSELNIKNGGMRTGLPEDLGMRGIHRTCWDSASDTATVRRFGSLASSPKMNAGSVIVPSAVATEEKWDRIPTKG